MILGEKLKDNINRVLEKYSFEIQIPLDFEGLEYANVTVKVHLIGTKMYVLNGNPTSHLIYSLSIESTNNNIVNLMYPNGETINPTNPYVYRLSNKVDNVLIKFLQFFGIKMPVMCVKAINNSTNKINEELIVEEKYDSVTKKLVKDILLTLKYQRDGEFVLPEDISDEMVYTFPQFNSEFTINLNLTTSEDVEDVDVDGEYYKGEDTIDINITTNPNIDRQILEKLYHELNDVVRHEIQHIIQYESGYKFPKREPKKPLKYYTQKHELEAQIAGFKRRAKKEKKPFETVVRDWFRNNSLKHNMTPNDTEKVINLILNSSN
jgi:hypothetical protein